MKLFSMLPQKFTDRIANETGLTLTENYKEPGIISIVIRKNKTGGIDDPTEYLVTPQNCIVIAGTPDKTGIAFSNRATKAGVPEDNIFLLPAGQRLSVNAIIEKILSIQQNILANDNDEDVFIFEDEEESAGPAPVTNRIKVIAVRGFRGGVGTTTITTSLAMLLHENGGKIAVVDLGIPPNAKHHCGNPQFDKKDGFLLAQTEYWDLYVPPAPVWKLNSDKIGPLIDILRKEYRWVVVDFSPQPDYKHIQSVEADKTVVVIDSDVVQSIEPAAIKNALFVYNKAIPDIGTEIVEDILGQNVITIKTDFEGCYAALASGEPAYKKSETIAMGMGKLAAKIQT
ncbi:cellulose synthase operon protein YhjQ/BcsQ [Desulfoscipio geothermicus]|uniref:CobQ/CobB/MinD/ParA nucleotide binding domain-containing protein n=1 Tax=Desulfoscipio geothermicus DSM 3669 TaxID=1121426 RepID=A0A1I6DNJ3_9FIRM|nr:cellulose synthase operon protein YhjQ/BcsQ [Desulfoscipio geothermicus]SFR07035.1 CobQ/CobB/MinD/ParA nucleotide binding domain-containing protein [Desulfoscipio geothermicus DSM 3669]